MFGAGKVVPKEIFLERVCIITKAAWILVSEGQREGLVLKR
jgi:hypothetical protein